MRIERELMRGAGPVAVLKLLEAGPRYGYELVESLARATSGVLDMGQSTLYPLLYNLEAQGFVKSQWETVPSGRQRRYYLLTAKGKKRLAKDVAQWKAVAQAMSALGIFPAATGRDPILEGGPA
jgi:PadR family transcriptional regulator PadR